jgi:hypothetical protein
MKILFSNTFLGSAEKRGSISKGFALWIPSFLDEKMNSLWDRKGEQRSCEPFHEKINFKGQSPLKFTGATHA